MPDEEMRGSGDDKKTEWKAFIGGLVYSMNNADLKAAFSKYDPADAEVMMDRHTGRPRGFGFVWFKDELGLKDAIRDMHEKELEGRKISVARAVPQDQTKPGTPAALLGGGAGARRYGGYERREYGGGGGRGGYDRGYGGGYDRGYDRYDRGGYGGGGYDPRYAGYDRGYDRGGYGGGYGSYDRSAAYSDPYRRDPYAAGYSYGGSGGHHAYEDRGYGGGGGGYDYGRSAGYDDRGAGGPDRRAYGGSAARSSAPYERPAERRAPEPVRR